MLRENQLDESIRKPMGKREAKKLLDHLKSWTGKVSNQWKTRANAHQLKMEAGEPLRYAEVFKTLKQRQAEASLSAADRNHLKQSAELLSEELANAIGKTPEQALRELSKAVKR